MIEDELQSVLDEWNRAILERDVAAADELLDDDYVLTSAGGVAPHLPRAAWLNALTQIETRSIDVDIVAVRSFGDIAVVASRLRWDARFDGRDLTGDYAVTDIFRYAEGRWRATWRVSTRMSEGDG